MIKLALEPITVAGLNPPDIVSVAAEAGYDAVAICLLPSAILGSLIEPLVDNPALTRETARRMAATGLTLSLGEGFVIAEGSDFELLKRAIDVAAALGAPCINCTMFDGERSRALDLLSKMVAVAAERGIDTAIEFSAFSPIASSLGTARAVVDELGMDRLGLLVDPLHVVRCGDAIAAIADIPPRHIKYVQICDGLLSSLGSAAYMDEALWDRMLPGEGELDLTAFVQLLPSDITVGIETPSRTLRARGFDHLALARYALQRTRELLS